MVAMGLLVGLSAAVVVSHQLTPYFLVATLVALFLVGRNRSWVLPVLVGMMTVAWTAYGYGYVSRHFTLFDFNPFDNAKGAGASLPSAGSFAHQMVGTASHIESAIAVGLAVLGWVVGRPGRRGSFVWVVVVATIAVLFVQSYGGEAIYRVYIFALPWLCVLGARALVRLNVRWPYGAPCVTLVGALASVLFVLSYFGLDRTTYMQPQEVRASTWFETATPPGSILVQLTGNWPSPVTALYPTHLNHDGNWGGDVYGDNRFAGRALTAQDVSRLEEALGNLTSGPIYLAIGPSQLAAIENYGLAPPGSAERFEQILLADPRIRVVYRDGDTVVLLLPGDPA
jgi:hypothetical protein